MRKRRIGDLINKVREDQNITQKQLCDGLCSVQTLSNIESGDRMPDVFLVEYLLQRLGISPDDLETILFDNEYRKVELRDLIEEKIEQGFLREAEKILEENVKLSRDSIERQYYYQIKAILASEKNNHIESLEYIEMALASTHTEYAQIGKKLMLLATKEIELLCMMADEYLLIENRAEAQRIVKFLVQYLEKGFVQDMELVKTYPKVAYLTNYFAGNKKERIDSISRYEKAFQLLTNRDSTVFLAEIMTLLIENYHEMNLINKALHLEKQLDCLKALCKEYKSSIYASHSSMRWFKESYRKEYLLCEEIIRGERLTKGIKRRELIEGVYEDPETLVRIENGSQSMSYKKYEMLMKRLNMPTEKYNGSPMSDGDIVSQSKNQITQYLIKHEYEEAKEELEKLRLIVEDEDYINKQYIAKEEAFLEYRIEQIDARTFMEKTKGALIQTYSGDIEEPLRIPTLEEAYIFNYLSLSYRKNGMQNQSLNLYQKLLNCYEESKIRKSYHYRTLTIFNRNYLLLLEEMGNWEDAFTLAEDLVKFELSAFRGQALDFICSEIMCLYEKAEVEEVTKKKAIEKYLRYAFYLSDLFARKNNNIIADKYYRKYVDNAVEWYK